MAAMRHRDHDGPDRAAPTVSSLRLLAAMSCVLVLAQGCMVFRVTEVSRPRLDSPAQGTIGRDGYVVVPGARVAVAAWNDWIATSMLGFPYLPIIPNPWHQWNAPGEEPDFWLDAAIDPQGDAVTFDPSRVRLHIEGRSGLAPSKMTGLVSMRDIDRFRKSWEHRRCGPVPPIDSRAIAPIVVREHSCVFLRFDTSRPNPAVSFTVKLDGLTNNGLPVVVPTIRFEFGRIWSQTRMNAR